MRVLRVYGTASDVHIRQNLSFKIRKKAKNARGGHIHGITAFFGGLQKI